MKLKEIVLEFIPGDWGTEAKTLKNPCKIRCIRGADFQPLQTNGKLNCAPIRYVAGNSLSSRKLKEGDIIIEKSGGSPTQSTGRALYVSDAIIKSGNDIMCSNFCVAIRVNSNWNSKYFYYFWTYLYSLGVFFNFESKTSGIKNLQLDSVLSSIEFPPIPLEQQKKIVSILNGIEEKILLNRKINRNLEATARQLYDYWFVQFDFPNENGQPYKSSGGKMVWNERLKRLVPDGWRDATLSDIANITMGQSPDGSSYNEDGQGILFYQGSTDFGVRFPSVRQYTTAPKRLAKRGDILISVRAPVGATNFANADCCIGRGLAAINSKIGSTNHLYHVIQDLKVAFEMRNGAGTTFGSLTKDDLYNLSILKPETSVLQAYENVCKNIFDYQMLIGEDIDKLEHMRDELLPLLMNSQVSVS